MLFALLFCGFKARMKGSWACILLLTAACHGITVRDVLEWISKFHSYPYHHFEVRESEKGLGSTFRMFYETMSTITSAVGKYAVKVGQGMLKGYKKLYSGGRTFFRCANWNPFTVPERSAGCP